jgi:hypothetical protein
VDVEIDGRRIRGAYVYGNREMLPAFGGIVLLQRLLAQPKFMIRFYLSADLATWIDTTSNHVRLIGEAKPLLFRLGRNRPAAERS